MKTTTRFAALACAVVLLFAESARAQEQGTASAPAAEVHAGSGTAVPRLIQFSGVVKDSTEVGQDTARTARGYVAAAQNRPHPVAAKGQF